jgi:nitrogen fixation/metabolism regulation signal transduction histidine kinase
MSFKRFYVKLGLHIFLLSIFIFLAIWAFYTDYLKFSKIGFSFGVLIELYFFFRFIQNAILKIRDHLKIISIDESLPRLKNDFIDKGFKEIEQELINISETYHANKIQNESEQAFLKLLFEQVDTGLLAFNEKGEIHIVNRAVSKLINKERIDNIQEFSVLGEKLPEIMQELIPGESRLVNITVQEKSRKFVFVSYQICFERENLKTVFVYDLSHELIKEELENWQKLLKTLRHEIINSITPIATLSETSLEVLKEGKLNELKDTPFEKEYRSVVQCLESVNNRCVNLEQFVKAYKEYSSIPSPSLKKINLFDLIVSIKSLLSKKLEEKGINFIVKSKNNIVITTDEALLSQVLINLVKNAEEAISNKGEILIEVIEKYRKTYIRIQDTGCGIPNEQKEKIFIPFFSTKETGQGIGLSFSRLLVHKLGGILSLKESSQEGTVMELVL